MPKLFSAIIDRVVLVYEKIKELDQIPMRNFSGEFYEEKESKKTKPAARTNQVKVEDLRPPRKD